MVVLAESFSIKIIFPFLTFSFSIPFFVSLCESVHNEIKSRLYALAKAFPPPPKTTFEWKNFPLDIESVNKELKVSQKLMQRCNVFLIKTTYEVDDGKSLSVSLRWQCSLAGAGRVYRICHMINRGCESSREIIYSPIWRVVELLVLKR